MGSLPPIRILDSVEIDECGLMSVGVEVGKADAPFGMNDMQNMLTQDH